MKFIVGADKNFKDLIEQSVEHLEKLGYDYRVYDLGGLGHGHKVDVPEFDFTRKEGIVRCLYKPKMIRHALKQGDEFIVYIDADVFVKENIDEVKGDYDIGVTKRRKAEVTKYENTSRVGKYNAGVIFFNNTEATREFVDEWEKLSLVLGIEQKAFNQMLGKTSAQVEEFSTNTYNNYYFDGTKGKIIHYKSDTKNRARVRQEKR